MIRNIQRFPLNSCYYLTYNRTLVGQAPISRGGEKVDLAPFIYLIVRKGIPTFFCFLSHQRGARSYSPFCIPLDP